MGPAIPQTKYLERLQLHCAVVIDPLQSSPCHFRWPSFNLLYQAHLVLYSRIRQMSGLRSSKALPLARCALAASSKSLPRCSSSLTTAKSASLITQKTTAHCLSSSRSMATVQSLLPSESSIPAYAASPGGDPYWQKIKRWEHVPEAQFIDYQWQVIEPVIRNLTFTDGYFYSSTTPSTTRTS